MLRTFQMTLIHCIISLDYVSSITTGGGGPDNFFVAVINIFNRRQYDPLGPITSTGGLYQYF